MLRFASSYAVSSFERPISELHNNSTHNFHEKLPNNLFRKIDGATGVVSFSKSCFCVLSFPIGSKAKKGQRYTQNYAWQIESRKRPERHQQFDANEWNERWKCAPAIIYGLVYLHKLKFHCCYRWNLSIANFHKSFIFAVLRFFILIKVKYT